MPGPVIMLPLGAVTQLLPGRQPHRHAGVSSVETVARPSGSSRPISAYDPLAGHHRRRPGAQPEPRPDQRHARLGIGGVDHRLRDGKAGQVLSVTSVTFISFRPRCGSSASAGVSHSSSTVSGLVVARRLPGGQVGDEEAGVEHAWACRPASSSGCNNSADRRPPTRQAAAPSTMFTSPALRRMAQPDQGRPRRGPFSSTSYSVGPVGEPTGRPPRNTRAPRRSVVQPAAGHLQARAGGASVRPSHSSW